MTEEAKTGWVVPIVMETHQAEPVRDQAWHTELERLTARYEPRSSFLAGFHYAFAEGHFVCEMEPILSEIQWIRSMLRWVLHQPLALDETTTEDLMLALEEVVSNVIRHAYAEGEACWLRVRLVKSEGRISLFVEDRGSRGREPALQEKWAQITTTGRPPLGKRGGLGMYLIRRIMTSLTYTPGTPLNLLHMERTLES